MVNYLENKKILLIICGGIAAYKSLELVRILKKKNVTIKTILTNSAKKFITPLSITSLSQGKIYDNLFDHRNEVEMDHISLSRWADIILISPATANIISKLSNGLADDLATTVISASNKKIFLVPSMNVRMWKNKINQNNVNKLRENYFKIIGPIIGDMACGEYGEGKMSEPIKIVEVLDKYFKNLQSNEKFKALVTAGPTIENIDPVRYISNNSSGKQGYETAKSLSNNGFDTTLISGPTNLDAPENVKILNVRTADEMFKETVNNLPVDVAIFSAAVSDYKIKEYRDVKIKKRDENLNLALKKNIDILSYVSKNNSLRPKLIIGFAAETNNIKQNAEKKLVEKNCDWIIANDISRTDIGFNSDMNEIFIVYNNKSTEIIPRMNKSLIADKLVKKIIHSLN